MAGGWGEIWWYGGDWYDRRQDRRYEEALAELRGTQAAETRRLRAQLQNVQGSLEQRVTRLAAAFDAFVEMSDLREELRAFQPAVMVRHRTRRLLAEVTRTDVDGASRGLVDVPDLAELGAPPASGAGASGADVPGYWLGPAGAALVALLRGDAAAAAEATAAARERDALRTDTFLCAALVLARRPELAAERLGPVLDLRADAPVTRAQQALWHAAADGLLGEAGRGLVGDRLTAAVGAVAGHLAVSPTGPEVGVWRALVDGLVPAPPAQRLRYGLPDVLNQPARAAARLEALSTWYAERVAPAAPADAAPDAERLAAVVEELVREGAPDERSLLQRVAELRRVIEVDGRAPGPPPTAWSDPVGELVPLVRSDADAPTPGRRAVAVRAAAPFLRAVADQLAAEASRPLPDEVDARVGRQTVRFRGRQPTSAGLEAVRSGLERLDATAPRPDLLPLALGAFGAFGLILGAVLGAPVLLVAGALAVIGAGGSVYGKRREAGRAEDFRRSERDRLDQEIARVGEAIGELRSRAAGAAERASAARPALDEVLPA